MPPIAYFGIESSGLSLAIDLLILFLIVLYGSLLYWTYADARRRISDPMMIGCAVVASAFPFVGTLVYMILRPPEYLEDVHERDLEIQAAEARLHDLGHSLCPHCDYRIERDFIRCPSCLRKLKERCASCSKPLDRAWTICPYCETDVPAAKPARRAAPRERAPASGASRARTSVEVESSPATAAVDAKAAVAPSSRARVAERAAVRAPDPAANRGAESEQAPSQSAPPPNARRPRSST